MLKLRTLPALALIPLLGILTGCNALVMSNRYSATETITKSFPAASMPKIYVETFNGEIDVMTGPSDKVQAKVSKKAGGATQEAAEDDLENIEVSMTQEKDTIRIVARQLNQKPMSNRGAAVELTVPEGTFLDLHTSNGKVGAAGLVGEVLAESSNGGITVKGSRGKLNLTTSNGPIVVEGGKDRLDLRTSNGGIDVKSDKCVISAKTSNGKIVYSGKLADDLSTFASSNGSITLNLPSDAQFQVEADTSNGKIRTDFPFKGYDGKKPKKSLKGSIGENPAASVRLHTSNGDVNLKFSK